MSQTSKRTIEQRDEHDQSQDIEVMGNPAIAFLGMYVSPEAFPALVAAQHMSSREVTYH